MISSKLSPILENVKILVVSLSILEILMIDVITKVAIASSMEEKKRTEKLNFTYRYPK